MVFKSVYLHHVILLLQLLTYILCPLTDYYDFEILCLLVSDCCIDWFTFVLQQMSQEMCICSSFSSSLIAATANLPLFVTTDVSEFFIFVYLNSVLSKPIWSQQMVVLKLRSHRMWFVWFNVKSTYRRDWRSCSAIWVLTVARQSWAS